MLPGVYTLYIRQGDTFSLSIRLKDSDGSVLDLSALDNARMQVRRSAFSDEILLDLSTDPDGGIVIDTSEDRINIRVDAEVTEVLPAILAAYDLELEDTGGTVTTVLAGQVRISREVTR